MDTISSGSASFWTLKMSLWSDVVFATFPAVTVKTYGRNYIYLSPLPNNFADILVSCWFIWWILGSYRSVDLALI